MQDDQKKPHLSERERRIISIYFLVILSVILIYFGVGAIINPQVQADSNETMVEIAVLAPITGAMSDYGNAFVTAVKLAVASPPPQYKVNGYLVNVKVYDTYNTAVGAASAAVKAAGRAETIAIIGPLDSRQVVAASDMLAEKDLVLITPAATAPSLVLNNFSGIYRIPITDNYQGQAIVGFLDNRKLEKVFMVGENEPSIPGIIETFNQAARNKIQIVGSVDTAKQEITPEMVQSMVDAEAQAVVYLGGIDKVRVLLQVMSEAELYIPVIGCELINNPDLLPLPDEQVQLFYSIPFITSNVAKISEKSMYSPVLKGQLTSPFAYEATVATWLVMESLSRSGDLTPREIIWNSLNRATIKNIWGDSAGFSSRQFTPGYIYLYQVDTVEGDWSKNEIVYKYKGQ